MKKKTDIIIIGAGPLGIELAVALKQHGLDYLHLEAGQIGSTIQWYAPETMFFSSPERIAISGVPLEIPGQRKATREEYLSYLRAVVKQFGLSITTYTRVTRITKSADNKFIITAIKCSAGVGSPELLRQTGKEQEFLAQSAPETTIEAKQVILAIGDMHYPKMLKVPGEDLPHVSHYFEDPHKYFGKSVLIVGGKNSAVEAAIRLYRLGVRVSISYRGDTFEKKRVKFWLLPEIEGLIRKGLIEYFPNTRVQKIGNSSVELTKNNELESSDYSFIEVPADFVLLMTGYVQDSSLFEMSGVQLQGSSRTPVFDKRTMETNIKGLFVCGNASAGTQMSGVKEFIETGHVHIPRIVSALTGKSSMSASDETSWMLET